MELLILKSTVDLAERFPGGGCLTQPQLCKQTPQPVLPQGRGLKRLVLPAARQPRCSLCVFLIESGGSSKADLGRKVKANLPGQRLDVKEERGA